MATKESKRRILMVDDDELMLSIIKKVFEGTGRFEVRTEKDSSRARRAAHEFKPELILLDVNMPNYDGGDVATFLGHDPATRSIPILFLTSMVTPEQVEQHDGTIAGHPFVAKPAGVREILRRVETILQHE